LIGLGALAAAGGLLASPQVQESEPLTLDEYWRQVEQTASAVEGLTGADGAAMQSELDSQAAIWEATTHVQLDDRTIVPVDSSYLVGLLREDPPDLRRVGAYLDVLLASRGSGSRSPRTISTPIGEILSRPEFQWEEPQPNPIQEALARFGEWLLGLFGGRIVIPLFGGRILMFIGLAILALLIGLALRGLIKDFISTAEAPEDALDDAAEILTADSALKRAQEVSSAGDYRSAVRYLYLSSLLILEERGLLNYDRTRTNREYLRSVSHRPELAATLRDVVDVFDRVWYGHQALDEASYDQYSSRVTDLRRQR
jgi:hypothetical protein